MTAHKSKSGAKRKKRAAPVRPDDPVQSKRFIAMAKELGADESPETFKKVTTKGPPKPRSERDGR